MKISLDGRGELSGLLAPWLAGKLPHPLPISMAEISLADGNRADFAANDPPNLWEDCTALEKPLERPPAMEKLLEKSVERLLGRAAERPLEKAALFPFAIRGRLLRETGCTRRCETT